ncbi:unnamed protein product [Caenorhabditis bovis]|uniref:CCHC-type domain-containing protein n=1 Tax=Caenorhabditis bovis TaxID=2654633 RepID=A0A8S1EEA2_9PELO|nr:unnamed protein product [Caenorhabditis bovis]
MALAKSLSLSDLSEIRISCAKPFSRMQDSDTVKGSQLKTLQSACVTDFEVTHGVMRSLAERAENRIKGFAEIPRINTVTASMRPSSQVPIFGGSPNDTFSAFLRSFNDHANTAKPPLGDLEKRNIFLTYLTDAARDRAEEFLEQESEASFATLVNHLKVKYEDPVRAELSRQQLRTTNQLPGESVDEFAAKVRKLANSSYLGYSREYIKAKTLEAFLDGLKYDIKFHVKASNPRTFEDALNSAVRNTPRQVKCYFCGRLGHMMANCFKKNRQFGRIDPIDNHQIRNRNQPIFGNPGRRTNNYEGNSSDVRNFQPDTTADDTVRELRAQVEALTMRNNQLTNNMTPRVNTGSADKLTKIVSRNAFSTSGSTKANEISEVISAYEQWLDLGHRLFQAWTAIVCTFVTLYAIFLVVAIFIKQQAEALPFSVFHRFGKKTANPPSEVIFDYSDLLPATTTIATFHSPQALLAQVKTKEKIPLDLADEQDKDDDLPLPTTNETSTESFANSLATIIREAWTNAADHALKAQEKFQSSYDASARPNPIQIGDRVTMKDFSAKANLSRKLVLPWKGQFRVVEINHPKAVVCDISRPDKPNRTVHLNQIKKVYTITGPAATTSWEENPEAPDISDSTDQADNVDTDENLARTESPKLIDNSETHVPENSANAESLNRRYNLRKSLKPPSRLSF